MPLLGLINSNSTVSMCSTQDPEEYRYLGTSHQDTVHYVCSGEEGGSSQRLISMNTQGKKNQTEVVPAATTDVCYMCENERK